MQIVGGITVDRRLFRDMLKAQMRGTLRMLRLLGVLVAVLALLLLWVLHPTPPITIGTMVTLPMWLLLPELQVYLSRRQFAGLTAEPWVYEVTEASVGVRTSQLRQEFDWDNFVALAHTPDLWVLRHRVSNLTLPIAKAAFAPADQAEIERLLASRGLVSA